MNSDNAGVVILCTACVVSGVVGFIRGYKKGYSCNDELSDGYRFYS